MTIEKENSAASDATAPVFKNIKHRYQQVSHLNKSDSDTDNQLLQLFSELGRDPVHCQAELKQPLKFQQSLMALYDVVASDYRYVPKDRSAYVAFSQMRRNSSKLSSLDAQQAYFDWLENNDPDAWYILDPVISVHPDKLFFEVFNKDESCYAKLDINYQQLKLAKAPVCGTTHIDFSAALRDSLLQMRSYKKSEFIIAQQLVELNTSSEESQCQHLEKSVKVPENWLRGFLQVQTASSLDGDSFKLKPIDLYNLLRELRLHKDIKGKKRGLSIELLPGQRPKLILEPWQTVIESTAEPYQGKQAKVIRIWGRRRLMLLKDLLSLTDDIEVKLLGNGLPSFWTLTGPAMNFTLAMTGFTSSNWSQSLNFDLLLPRAEQKEQSQELVKLVELLKKNFQLSLKELVKQTDFSSKELLPLLQQGCQFGYLMYDLVDKVYRYRPLLSEADQTGELQYRNLNEKLAFELVERATAIKQFSHNTIYNKGTELSAQITVKEDKRDYLSKLLINEEGNVDKAECTCHFYLQNRLTKGPCSHLIALRITFDHFLKNQKSAKAQNQLEQEVKNLSKRSGTKRQVYQLFFEKTKLQIRWGADGEKQRKQQLMFNSVDKARNAYFDEIKRLQDKGFIDCSAD